eukprot:7167855-Lingulodinium_polyedra.AAC.1
MAIAITYNAEKFVEACVDAYKELAHVTDSKMPAFHVSPRRLNTPLQGGLRLRATSLSVPGA